MSFSRTAFASDYDCLGVYGMQSFIRIDMRKEVIFDFIINFGNESGFSDEAVIIFLVIYLFLHY